MLDGLGPRFNSNSCFSCHSQPAPGGEARQQSAGTIRQLPNSFPSFIQRNGPAREVRFIQNPDGTPDGGVHALFTIGGRFDRPTGCSPTQEDFSNTGNIIFRIPTPTLAWA